MENVPTPIQPNQPAQPGQPAQAPADPYAEKFAALESNFNATLQRFQKQLDGLSFAARKGNKSSDEPTPEQNVTLKSLKAELETRDAKIRERAISTEMDAYFKSRGIPDSQAKILKGYVKTEYAAKRNEDGQLVSGLTVDENDNVVWVDDLGNKKPFGELGQKLLSSIGAENFMPPVQTPGMVGSRGGVPFGNVPYGQQAPDLNSMSIEQMMANPKQAEAGARALAAQMRQNQTIRT